MTYQRQSEKHRSELRRLYGEATLTQRHEMCRRYVVKADVYAELDGLPIGVAMAVSAVEGFTRYLLVRAERSGYPDLKWHEAYAKWRHRRPVDLVCKWLSLQQHGQPKDVFGSETWDIFSDAVAYRNLTVHDATGLNGGTQKALIDATAEVYHKLAALAGVGDNGRASPTPDEIESTQSGGL